MEAITARELGFEHLGGYVAIPAISGKEFQLIGVSHRVPLSSWATLSNPTPEPVMDRGYVRVTLNGVADYDLLPDAVVLVGLRRIED